MRAGWPGFVLLLNSCASPREHYYLLEQSIPADMSVSANSSTVLIGPVVLPQEVDRPQIVVRSGPHEVLFNEQERWAVPLKEALPRMFASKLTRDARNTRFVPTLSGVASDVKAHLAIDVLRLEVSRETGASVEIHWVYWSSGGSRAVLEGDAFAHAIVETLGVEGLVESLRRALTEVAASIGKQLPAGP
jgi:uncharacterized protein